MVSNVFAFPARSPRPFSLSTRDQAEGLTSVEELPGDWYVEFEAVRDGDLAAFVEHHSGQLGLSYIIGRCCDVIQVTRDRGGAWEDLPDVSSVPEAFGTIARDLIALGFASEMCF